METDTAQKRSKSVEYSRVGMSIAGRAGTVLRPRAGRRGSGGRGRGRECTGGGARQACPEALKQGREVQGAQNHSYQHRSQPRAVPMPEGSTERECAPGN